MSVTKIGKLFLTKTASERLSVYDSLFVEQFGNIEDENNEKRDRYIDSYQSKIAALERIVNLDECIVDLQAELAETKSKLDAYKKAVLQKDGLDRVVERDSKREEFGKDWRTEMLKFDKEFLIALMKSHILAIRKLKDQNQSSRIDFDRAYQDMALQSSLFLKTIKRSYWEAFETAVLNPDDKSIQKNWEIWLKKINLEAAVNKSKFAVMPRELTAENGAKAFFSSEFRQLRSAMCYSCSGSGVDEVGTCEPCEGSGELNFQDVIDWDTIKTIYKSVVDKMEIKTD